MTDYARQMVDNATGTAEQMRKAVDILCDFPREMAQILKVTPNEDWRDVTGTGHVTVRVLESLNRQLNGNIDGKKAGAALGTVTAAVDGKGEWFCDDAKAAGKVAEQILMAEMTGKPLKEAVDQEGLDVMAKQLDSFAMTMAEKATAGNADEATKAYNGQLMLANKFMQRTILEAKQKLNVAPGAKPSEPKR